MQNNMIDKTILSNRIHEKAEQLFHDIQFMGQEELNDNLRYFAEKSKDIAESILEDYIFSVVSQYTEGEKVITDSEKLAKFVNFSTGYQQQMLNWISDNPLLVKEELFEMPVKECIEDESLNVSPKIVLGLGTVISVGLCIFSKVLIAVAAEIMTIALAKIHITRSEKNNYIRRQKEEEIYAQALDVKRDELVYGVISELEEWLILGEQYSNNVLQSLGV